jgi:hypothetical protein
VTWAAVQAAITGLAAGVLSGLFGIGGGIVIAPSLKLWVGVPALVAVATPLVAIIPGSIAGASTYVRAREARLSDGFTAGLAGVPFAILGALGTKWAGGTIVLAIQAVLVLWMAGQMLVDTLRRRGNRRSGGGGGAAPAEPTLVAEAAPAAAEIDAAERPHITGPLVAIGAIAGLFSGFLGLGGGFVVVPLLVHFEQFSMKRAVGTSLITIAFLAVPSAITHAVLGHIDWALGLALIVGIVPGALVGARLSLGSNERGLRLAFAGLLIVVGVTLGANALGWL